MGVKIDGFAHELCKQLSQYTAEVEEAVEEIKDDITKEAVTLLRKTSPKDTGDYSKGWTKKKVGKNIVIYNKTKGQLTHVLENGHVKATGGRVSAKVHIRPVEEKITESYQDRVEKVIKQ